MIPFLCKSAFSGTEDCMASSVEGEKPAEQADLDSGHLKCITVREAFLSIFEGSGATRLSLSLTSFDLQR